MLKLDNIEVNTLIDLAEKYKSFMRTRIRDLDFLFSKVSKMRGFPVFWMRMYMKRIIPKRIRGH